MMKRTRVFACLCLTALLTPILRAGDFPGVESLVARRAPWLLGHVRFERLSDASAPAGKFILEPQPGGVLVRATDASAAGMGLGWYLKYTCARSMSHMGDNLSAPQSIPPLAKAVTVESNAAIRYALNYCTFNYTMSFYSWEDWEHELDWMALSGVNLMLVANGQEAVWQGLLRRLGFSGREIEDFIPGPAYTAWWLMGNLEGAGGPMSESMINRRSALTQRMLARMRELGIEPLMPGFYGMVPASMATKLHAHILEQGKWASFDRPWILDPTDPAFARVAGLYYKQLRELYGADIKYFSGDPFHEGGIFTGVSLPLSGKAIQEAMLAQFPGSTWVLQGWLDNPRRELLEQTDRSHVLVQELMGEATRNWELRKGYEGTPFVWCCINNFGERPGVFGALQRYADETYRVRTSPYAGLYRGVGVMPEGIANNPVAYDLALELGWHGEHVDVAQWIPGFVRYRYGSDDPDLQAAWSGLLATAYTLENANGPENVLCSRPAVPTHTASAWGSLKIGYDPARFEEAVERFRAAAVRFQDSETYRNDRVALELQVISNRALAAAARLESSLKARDKDAFAQAKGAFLSLGDQADRLLDSEPMYRFSTYMDKAAAYGTNPREKEQCVRNAATLVTYWGRNGLNSDELHDYAFKSLAGMFASYDMGRWKEYFDALDKHWDDPLEAKPDFFDWERDWVDRQCATFGRQ